MADALYLDHFRLRCAPFSIAPDPGFLYLSDRHREALAHLLWALQHDGGFVVLTGEVGTGKTTLSRCLLAQTPDDTDIAYLINPRLNASELLTALRKELGDVGPEPLSDREQVDRIHDHLLKTHAAGRRTLLLIDEAQNLTADVLEQLRLLTNLETDERKLLQVILLGQPELDQTLRQPALRQLDQRVTARYHLSALTRKELQACIDHRLQVAGSTDNPFTWLALRELYRASAGIPRLANLIADRALLGAYAANRQAVNAKLVRRAAREVRGAHRHYGNPAMLTATVAAVIVAAGLLLTIYLSWPLGPEIPALQTQPPAELTPPSEPAAARTIEPIILQTAQRPQSAPPWAIQTRREAFQQVLDSWYVPLALQAGQDPCAQVGQVGLACVEFELDLEELLRYDLPAVLHLAAPLAAYTSLVGWQNDSPLIGSPSTPEQVDAETLGQIWDGTSTLLWQMPPGYGAPIRDGSRGPAVVALQEALRATGDLEQGQPGQFDESAATAVRRFQERNDIMVDGVAGPQTWILLLRETGTGIPSLIGAPSEAEED